MTSEKYSWSSHSWHSQEAKRQQLLWQSFSALTGCVAMVSIMYLATAQRSYQQIKRDRQLESKGKEEMGN